MSISKEGKIGNYQWNLVESINLTPREQQRLDYNKLDLVDCDTHFVNEATIWARAIYPMLLLAEKEEVQAYAGIPFYAKYDRFNTLSRYKVSPFQYSNPLVLWDI